MQFPQLANNHAVLFERHPDLSGQKEHGKCNRTSLREFLRRASGRAPPSKSVDARASGLGPSPKRQGTAVSDGH